MNIAARLARFEDRGFNRETAAVNVLLEQALQVLLSAFPDTFVFFGGASLVLFYGSPRHSGDLDLLTSADAPPSAAELEAVLWRPLSEVAETLGFGELTIEPARGDGDFLKLAVKSALVAFPASSEQTTVAVPSRNLQLLFKAEAFLRRSSLKARDAFDIKLLQDSGAVLSDSLTVHLMDGPAAERLENPEFITQRIAQVNSRTCTPELQPYLPKDIFEKLESSDFEPLRAALRHLFSAWL